MGASKASHEACVRLTIEGAKRHVSSLRCCSILADDQSQALAVAVVVSELSMMTDQTRTILNHYNIATPYPTSWPTEKDESDSSENEGPVNSAAKIASRKPKSRYSVLERSGSDRRSLVPGSQKTRDGVENLVQKDEPDPLGATDSVVRALRQKGLPVEEDQRLREQTILGA